MGVLKGDFIGFQFGEYHSSDLGIVRISDGTRYNDEITPVPVDKTVQRPGSDGTYFFNSFYSQKPITITFAFDSLTEAQFRLLRQVFATKIPQKLIFDEAPYKYYLAKCGAAPQMKYLCFEEDEQRIYKGEGSLSLMAYYPYAKSVYKWIDQYIGDDIDENGDIIPSPIPAFIGLSEDEIEKSKKEWNIALGLKEQKNAYDVFKPNGDENHIIASLYNPGDLEANFILKFPFKNSAGEDVDFIGTKGSYLTIKIQQDNNILGEIKLSCLEKLFSNDAYVYLNTNTELLEGYDINGYRTGTIYNKYKVSGSFYKIPLGNSEMLIEGTIAPTIATLEYDYFYY